MPAIHEVAKLSSKGQVTLPKAIRQILALDTGSKIAFELRDGDVVVSRVNSEHEDPAIGAFLDLLASDIRSGGSIQALPAELAQAMLGALDHRVDLDEDIDGAVSL